MERIGDVEGRPWRHFRIPGLQVRRLNCPLVDYRWLIPFAGAPLTGPLLSAPAGTGRRDRLAARLGLAFRGIETRARGPRFRDFVDFPPETNGAATCGKHHIIRAGVSLLTNPAKGCRSELAERTSTKHSPGP